MNTKLLDGKKLQQKKFAQFKTRIAKLKKDNIIPCLAVVQVGNNAASTIYIKHKQKACEALGINFVKVPLVANVTYGALKNKIDQLNADHSINGILIQFPLPDYLSKRDVSLLIDPNKDVDGIHPLNQGINFTRVRQFAPVPCTARGIMELLDEYQIPIAGKNALIIGRSNIVGRPISYLLANANSTVFNAHSQTDKLTLKKLVQMADIIVLATGQMDLISPDMVHKNAIIIDVGIIRMSNGKLRGDIIYKNFINKVAAITPVPGGVGPMTIAMLINNIIELTEKRYKK